MKIVIIIYMVIFLTSVGSAEVYTWEDANVIHFSDSPSSMPEENREKIFEETRAQIENTAPQGNVGITQQKRPDITHVIQTAAYQADPEQPRQASVMIKRPHMRESVVSSNIVKDSFPSLASLVVVWVLLALFLIITWVLTIVDIVRSSFITPSIRTAWMLLVIFIPLIGMEFYYILGLSQKCNSIG